MTELINLFSFTDVKCLNFPAEKKLADQRVTKI